MHSENFIRPKKKLGQVFLVTKSIAEAEAAHSHEKVVLEVGPGRGILTRELCKHAKKVIAVEKDTALYDNLSYELNYKNLKLINKDFFDATDEEMELDKIDIMISNIPYNISSPVIEWLSKNKIEAVLCLQKEFVEHMLAKPDTHNYSKLSVISSLTLKVVKIMNVKRGSFWPPPKVDSAIIYIKPKQSLNEKERQVISALIQHKKKTVKNALIDSHSYLNLGKDKLNTIAGKLSRPESRVFKLTPEEILELSREINTHLK